MAELPAPPPRQRLLDAVVEHFAAEGMHDLSLRRLATAVGTSHRMLLYHFGSREGLLRAVAQEVERRQEARLEELAGSPELSPVDAIWQMWDDLADASMHAHERLFFDVYVRALGPGENGRAFLDQAVDLWLGPARVLFGRLGFAPDEAEAEARLALAVARGLLLDLLASGDRAATDAAMRRYVARFAGLPDAGPRVAAG